MSTKDELIAEAKDKNVEIDSHDTKAEIQQKLDEADASGKPAAQTDLGDLAPSPVAAPDHVEVAPKADGPVHVTSEHYYATERSQYGLPVVDIAKTGWVGPANLTIPADHLDEIIGVLKDYQKAIS